MASINKAVCIDTDERPPSIRKSDCFPSSDRDLAGGCDYSIRSAARDIRLGIRLDRNLRRADGLELLESCQEVAKQNERN